VTKSDAVTVDLSSLSEARVYRPDRNREGILTCLVTDRSAGCPALSGYGEYQVYRTVVVRFSLELCSRIRSLR
jgi:hypothetical protein